MSAYYNTRNCNPGQSCRRRDIKNLLKKENTVESNLILSIFSGGGDCWQAANGLCWITESGQPWLLG